MHTVGSIFSCCNRQNLSWGKERGRPNQSSIESIHHEVIVAVHQQPVANESSIVAIHFFSILFFRCHRHANRQQHEYRRGILVIFPTETRIFPKTLPLLFIHGVSEHQQWQPNDSWVATWHSIGRGEADPADESVAIYAGSIGRSSERRFAECESFANIHPFFGNNRNSTASAVFFNKAYRFKVGCNPSIVSAFDSCSFHVRFCGFDVNVVFYVYVYASEDCDTNDCCHVQR